MNSIPSASPSHFDPFLSDHCLARGDEAGSHFHTLVEDLGTAIVVTTRGGTVLFANRAATELFHCGENDLQGKTFGFALNAGERSEIEIALPRGGKAAMEMQVSEIRWDRGIQAYAVSLYNISTYRNLKASLLKSNERLRTLLAASPLAIITLDSEMKVMLWNQGAEKLFGWSEHELIGQPLNIASAQGRDEIRPYCEYALENKTISGIELAQQRRRNGSLLDIGIWAAPLHDSHALICGVLLIVADITAHKQAEAQVRHLSNHNALTGLPNRATLLEFLQITLRRGGADDTVPSAILYLGLDRFKQVNESLGHESGDRLLKQVGERLRQAIRETDTLAHVGGDEFAVLLPGVGNANDASQVAKKIHNALAAPFHPAESLEVFASASIGIAVAPNDSREAEALLHSAEAAMRRAKHNGGNHYQFFTPEMNACSLHRLSMESSLRKALEREEFVLHFQPQFNIRRGEIIGAEALVRWTNAEGVAIPPGHFIPVAEECGLIVPLGEWVLRQACRQAAAWRKAGHEDLVVAVNVSPLQFRRNIHKTVARLLQETGLEARLLDIELTEGTVMHDPDAAVVMLKRLKSMGVRISIDDFGMGYSSLSYLKRFPIDKLKIDQSFVRDLTTDPDDAAIVGAIINLATSLKLEVIAEGVETQQQLDYLNALQCEAIQGYFLSRPLTARAFESFVQEYQHSP